VKSRLSSLKLKSRRFAPTIAGKYRIASKIVRIIEICKPIEIIIAITSKNR
jgi:hypothetical protein